jgi:hypothetical protein
MKTFLKLFVLSFAMFLIYLLLMLLFAWMVSWWWVFIIIVGVGGISSMIGFGQLAAPVAMSVTTNLFGRILLGIFASYYLWFSIDAVWGLELEGQDSKIMAVKIIATLVFAQVYLPYLITAVISPSSNKET